MGRHRAQPALRYAGRRRRVPARRGFAAAAVGLVAAAALAWQPSTAAFTTSSSNPANALSSGHVAVAAAGAGSAVFSVSNLLPGSYGEACVLVTYTGDLAASVKLYAENYADSDLGAALTLTIEQGSGTTCASFGTPTTLYNGSLRGFATTATGWGTGLGSFTPSAAGEAKPFRLAYFVGGNNSAQGDTVTVDLVWQARST